MRPLFLEILLSHLTSLNPLPYSIRDEVFLMATLEESRRGRLTNQNIRDQLSIYELSASCRGGACEPR